MIDVVKSTAMIHTSNSETHKTALKFHVAVDEGPVLRNGKPHEKLLKGFICFASFILKISIQSKF